MCVCLLQRKRGENEGCVIAAAKRRHSVTTGDPTMDAMMTVAAAAVTEPSPEPSPQQASPWHAFASDNTLCRERDRLFMFAGRKWARRRC